MKKPILALALLTGVLLLQGCAAVVVGGAAGTAKASGDRRTLGAQWDDQTIELKAANLFRGSSHPGCPVGRSGHRAEGGQSAGRQQAAERR